jgi:putative membrane-bound dehydrogenase-like protein
MPRRRNSEIASGIWHPEFCHSHLLSLTICNLVFACCVCPGAQPGSAPRSPAEELASFRLADPALTVELVASEPQVASPVAIAWDADGFLYVAEMIDYPVAPPAGRIRRLEDHDGDGVYERTTVFAEGLPFANGVLPCYDGVLVTAAPHIWYLRDRDGDGRADERRVVLTGFGEGNPQLRVNGLFRGLDNWFYAANGRSDGEVRAPEGAPGKSVSIRRRDVRFRFDPARKDVEVEATAGFSQFGLAHDDWGNRFPSWNTIPIRHVVLEQQVLDRNPFLAETTTVASILDPADGGRVYSISPVQERFNRESVNYFNASCGPTIFRGDGLASAYRGNAFVCEPLTNLVHRRVLETAGCTFMARRVEAKTEFLASTDSCFRPVNLTTGPDGALYVVDMYRELVEHPDFVPPDLRSKVEFRRWHNRGRIWRIRTRGEGFTRVIADRLPRLSMATVEDVVDLLAHPVGWYRDTAQRLLVEGHDRRASPLLRERARSSENPLARLHALWALAGLRGLDDAILDQAARDPHPAVREHAIRLALSGSAGGSKIPGPRLVTLAGDPSVCVRLLAAIALGDQASDDGAALDALASLAMRDASDLWVRLAVLSGLRETAVPVLRRWVAGNQNLLAAATPDQVRLLAETAAVVGARRRDDEIRAVLELVTSGIRPPDASAGRLALLAGLGEGLDRSGTPLHDWLGQPGKQREEVAATLTTIWTAARTLVLSDQPAEVRRLALEALVYGAPGVAVAVIPRLLQTDQPMSLQTAAARAVGRIGGSGLAATLIERWDELPLAVRRELTTALVASPALASTFLTALETGKVPPAEIDAAARDALVRLAEPALKRRAVAILARAAPADRSVVVQRYQAALGLKGDASRGAPLFTKHCHTCHEFQGQGHRVGPDLSGIAGRSATVLLSDILDPNRDVAPDAVAVTVATRRGQIASGLLVEETASGLKLRKADGVDQTILRSEIAEVRSTGRSLMPDGLEQSLNPQEMADLLTYLSRSPPEVPR